jgi:hypothetical protein
MEFGQFDGASQVSLGTSTWNPVCRNGLANPVLMLPQIYRSTDQTPLSIRHI